MTMDVSIGNVLVCSATITSAHDSTILIDQVTTTCTLTSILFPMGLYILARRLCGCGSKHLRV